MFLILAKTLKQDRLTHFRKIKKYVYIKTKDNPQGLI